MTDAATPPEHYRRFESLREYEQLTNELLGIAGRTVRIFDKTLSRDYNTVARCELLRHFLLRSRVNRLHVVIHETGDIVERLPRFTQLLLEFGHAAKLRRTLKAAKQVYDPFIVVDDVHYLHRFHYDHMRAAQGTGDADGARELIDRFEEIWEASEPCSPGQVTGL